MSDRYNHRSLEKENLSKVTEFSAQNKNIPSKGKYYCLEMFPYPSGKIHMGHIRNYALGDILARMKYAQGYEVVHPMGWDSFGLPAENAAKEKNIHPQKWTLENIAAMKQQLQRLGLYINWDQEVTTCMPDYYGQQQRIFLAFLQNDIAYKKESFVNWDPVDETVLANEQVIDGCGWRSGAPVVQKKLNQWFLRISDFAEDLLSDLSLLGDWPERVRLMQEKWIGKSVGAQIDIALHDGENNGEKITIFTTRHETLFGMSYVALALDHPIIAALQDKDADLKAFTAEHLGGETEDKKGYRTSLMAVNPVNGNMVPVFAANYVLSDYGSGAVFGCPAHDERDYEFAQKYDLPIIQVIVSNDGTADLPFTDKNGVMVASGEYDGLDLNEAREKIMADITKAGYGGKKITYRLRDWGVSRQRYWGCPIPVIYCDTCGAVPVPDNHLPVRLPDDIDFAKGGNPLENHPKWKHTNCPKCDRSAIRDTDTLDTFFDSSWYFLRYLDNEAPYILNKQKVNRYLPVDKYIGGIEHAVLHLLYARFMTKALSHIGLIDVKEPFKALFTQGMVCHATYKSSDGRWLEPIDIYQKDGETLEIKTDNIVTVGPSIKMSKSKKNIVDPEEIIQRYGADTARWFVLSDSPPEKDVEWTEAGAEASFRFLQKLWTLLSPEKNPQEKTCKDLGHKIMLRLREYEKYLETMAYNKAIAKVYEMANIITDGHKKNKIVPSDILQNILICLYPFTPFLADAIYQNWPFDVFLQQAQWPDFSKVENEDVNITLAVQILGKLRGTLDIPKQASQESVEQSVQNMPLFEKYIEGKTVKKIIYVPGRIINYVVI